MTNGKRKVVASTIALFLMFTSMSPVHAAENYTVKSGDVLWKIARQFGITCEDVEKANNLSDPNVIYAGQNLLIPDKEAIATSSEGQLAGLGRPLGPKVVELGDTVLDTPEVILEIEKARLLAGDDKSLMLTQAIQSRDVDENGVPSGPPGVNLNEDEEHAPPTQLFDNLYYVGGTEVGCFIFTTSEGYIMIDSGYKYMSENYIVAGMLELGLDPAKLKYIMITHAGPDHIGGAKYFKDNYGTQIVMSEEEWAMLAKRPSSLSPAQGIVGTDGQELTLGDTTITMVKTPRNIGAGGLSYIAPVFDNGEPHMWATYGNTGVTGTLEDKNLYRESVAKFRAYVETYNVDVIISNHPFVDGSLELMEELRNRQTGEPNPFVFGQERVTRFLKVLDQSCVVLMTREIAGLDDSGTLTLEMKEGADTSEAAYVDFSKVPRTSLDTPEIIVELQKAIDLAGDNRVLMTTQEQQCKVSTYHGANEAIDPIQLFDNLYFIGTDNVGVFIFTTTDGYIMIDSGYDYFPENHIIPGMEALGLDPAEIKYIMITHAGPDHVGGAEYFQKNYGTRIVMSEEEWDGAGGGFTSAERDIVAVDGDKLTLGDTSITMVSTQRRVEGGGFSYIAQVFDNGEPHMWATYGNTNVVGNLDDKAVYKDAVENFLNYVDEYNVDVVISSHPFVDGSVITMEELRNRQAGEPNPFVFGETIARRFFEILAQSAEVMTLRQEAGIDETGYKLLSEVLETPSRRPR